MSNHSSTSNNLDWYNWINIIKEYNKPSISKSWWQIINSLGPYLALWVVMVLTIDISLWLTLALAFIAACFLVRVFIIFHDCGHGSFFKSQKLSRVVGIITGFLAFTPYHKWHYEHQQHHQTVGNLDKRGHGDVMTLTVDEYKALSPFKRFHYRFYRNPFILFIIAPILLFVVQFRIPGKNKPTNIKVYTHLTTFLLIGAILLLGLLLGFKTFLLIQIPILFFASIFGVWLFYVQHQFEDVVWERSGNWDYKTIAMTGSSFYKLPRVMQWFSGNIGFHHIHHLGPRIPNYNLERCVNANPIFQKDPLTFWKSLKCMKYSLWDEKEMKLVGFKGI